MPEQLQTRKINTENMVMSAASIQVKDNGEGAKTAPITIEALSGEPIYWPYWDGAVIFDLAGMVHKDKITIDWMHDDNEIIGYVNHFGAEMPLVLGGTLVPFGSNPEDRALEVIHKEKAGVPYEASIDFRPRDPSEMRMEIVGEGDSVEVNGQTYDGPVTVFRRWRLTSIAICPHGKDGMTVAHLQNANKEMEVEVTMSTKDQKTVEAQAAEAAAVEAQAKAEAEKIRVEAEAQAAAKAEQEKAGRAEFQAFCDEFGEAQAAVYYKAGLSIEDARKQCVKDIRKKNEEIEKENAELKAAKAGSTAVDTDDDDEPNDAVQLSVTDAQIEAFAAKAGSDPKKLKESMEAEARRRASK